MSDHEGHNYHSGFEDHDDIEALTELFDMAIKTNHHWKDDIKERLFELGVEPQDTESETDSSETSENDSSETDSQDDQCCPCKCRCTCHKDAHPRTTTRITINSNKKIPPSSSKNTYTKRTSPQKRTTTREKNNKKNIGSSRNPGSTKENTRVQRKKWKCPSP